MIARMLILIALKKLAGAIGGPIGSALAGVLHEGGIVGKDGAKRSVDPILFTGASRYHSGGIAGLSPDEVPAILQRGEMVIPKNQVGGIGAAPQEIAIRNIIVDDFRNAEEFARSGTNEKIIVETIRRNAMTVKSVLA